MRFRKRKDPVMVMESNGKVRNSIYLALEMGANLIIPVMVDSWRAMEK
jgi:hypothetical protein